MAIRFGRGLTIEGRSASKVIQESRDRVKKRIEDEVRNAPRGTPIEKIVKKIEPEIVELEEAIQEDEGWGGPGSLPDPPKPEITVGGPGSLPSPDDPKPEMIPLDEDEVGPQNPDDPVSTGGAGIVETDAGQVDPATVQKVYDGLEFDWAPGVPVDEVIANPEAYDPEDRWPYNVAREDVGTTDILTPGQYYQDPDPLDFAGNPVTTASSYAQQTTEEVKELTPFAQGGTWYAVTGFPGLPVAYFIEYTLPGGTKIYYHADRNDLDGLEGIGVGKEPPIIATVSYNEFKQGRISGGSISDVVGTNLHYSARVERTLMAPTGDLLLPDWANNDPEIKDMFYVAVAENWTDAQFLKKMSKTNAFQERYPAFNDMLSLTGGSYDRALINYQQYEENIRLLNNRYGETADVKDLAAESIRKGFTVDDLKETYDIFERAEKNAGTLLAFQNIIDSQGLGFDVTSTQGIVDFFKGSAPTEIYDLYEATSISEQAAQLDLTDLSVEEALDIARNIPGQLTNQQISASLQSAAQMITRYREYVDLGKYGLDADTIINLSLGYKEPGGLTEMELTDIISRIVKEDENLQNLASGLAGSKAFAKKARQIRSID